MPIPRQPRPPKDFDPTGTAAETDTAVALALLQRSVEDQSKRLKGVEDLLARMVLIEERSAYTSTVISGYWEWRREVDDDRAKLTVIRSVVMCGFGVIGAVASTGIGIYFFGH